MPSSSPFFVHHTIHLSRGEVLEALRSAALTRARETLRLTDPAARGVELETRLLSGVAVEVDGAAIAIDGKLPDDLVALLRTGLGATAAAAVAGITHAEQHPAAAARHTVEAKADPATAG